MTKFFIFILLIPTLSYGQKLTTTERSEQGNIYSDAIKHFIVYESGRSTFDTLFIIANDLLIDGLQSTIQSTKIIILDSTEISNRLQDDSSFMAHKLFPLSFDNGHIFINIVPFYVHRVKSEVLFENTG